LLFHRVIEGFMIQTGDPNSKNAQPGTRLGYGGPSYTIPQEFRKQFYHKKGALSAARQPDNVNPSKSSSSSQFYIVQGKPLTQEMLDKYVEAKAHIPFTEEQTKDYTTVGGTPHLDYEYTVFGQVTEGLEIIDKIAAYSTDSFDRPLKDVKIISIEVIKK
jgi:cyclophilin family peptidyl-prolyl cis-trans isomerase